VVSLIFKEVEQCKPFNMDELFDIGFDDVDANLLKLD